MMETPVEIPNLRLTRIEQQLSSGKWIRNRNFHPTYPPQHTGIHTKNVNAP